jgi:hypothetical protein
VPSELLPGAGALAPAAWAADGTLLFAAPRAEDIALATPTPVGSAARPLPRARLQALAPGRTDTRPLGDAPVLAVAPTVGPSGTLLALDRAPDGGLVMRTLDATGRPLAEQALEVRASGPLAVRWDLAHARLVLLQAAAAGGIDARVLLLNDPSAPQETRP